MRAVLFVIIPLVLAACGSNAPAPVEDRSGRVTLPSVGTVSSGPRSYRVQRGDTLYAIAFRYGLDYRKVAAANRIPAPYTIYVGQEIALREGSLPVTAPPVSKPLPKRPQPIVQDPSTSGTVSAKPERKPEPKPARPASPVYSGAPVTKWRWPSDGPVTRRFAKTMNKGIDIGGKRGDPVVAVAPGKVVYAGTGISGYGELLIVKHNEEYLSAYGHNDRLLVAEGDIVASGQAIARKGSSGTADSVKLHFQIRREGKPIDPQRVLPRR